MTEKTAANIRRAKELRATGMTRAKIAEMMSVEERTVTRWRRSEEDLPPERTDLPDTPEVLAARKIYQTALKTRDLPLEERTHAAGLYELSLRVMAAERATHSTPTRDVLRCRKAYSLAVRAGDHQTARKAADLYLQAMRLQDREAELHPAEALVPPGVLKARELADAIDAAIEENARRQGTI